jgi:hypothetical protein
MRSSSVCKPSPLIRIALISTLALLGSGWTCSAMFLSCQNAVQPRITSLSPDRIPGNAEAVLLIAIGNGFTAQSQIMWNGHPLQTTFVDSEHLQTTITRETFDAFGSVGSSVQISVRSQVSFDDMGCRIGGDSATLILVIE